MILKAIIIEDEEPARALLKEYLKNFDQIEVVDECRDGFEGIKSIATHKPDLIFLDIQMPRVNGVEMLEAIDKDDLPVVIFTTAYDEYAVKAFEMNALDYILKPISMGRLTESIGKVLQHFDLYKSKREQLGRFISQGSLATSTLERIVVNSASGLELIPDQEIYCLEANDDYVLICTEAREYLKKKTMRYYEERLDPTLFMRVHRSFIVNTKQIKRIEMYSKDSWLAILKNDRRIAISKQGYSALKKAFDF